MNKFVFSLLLGLLIIACQNTPKTVENSPITAPAAPVAPEIVTPEAVQEATANLTTGVKMSEDLRKQVDALPTKIRKANAAEIDGMYSTLEGMIEKQTGMLNEIKASSTSATGSSSQENGIATGPSLAQMKEYAESAARYAQEAQAIQEAVRKMAKN